MLRVNNGVLVVPPFECAWLTGDGYTLRSGSGCISFEAKGDTDVTVILKSTPGAKRLQPLLRQNRGQAHGGGNALQVEQNYTIILGSHRNSCLKIEKNGVTQCMVTGVACSRVSSKVFSKYWIDLNHGVLTVGHGEPGENVCHQWRDTQEIPGMQHIGLSCWDCHVSYRSIALQPPMDFTRLQQAQLKGSLCPVPSLFDATCAAITAATTPDNVCRTLQLAELLLPTTQKLYRYCLDYIARHFETVVSLEPYAEHLRCVSPAAMCDLVCQNTFSVDERGIFAAVRDWAVSYVAWAAEGGADDRAPSNMIGTDGAANGGGEEATRGRNYGGGVAAAAAAAAGGPTVDAHMLHCGADPPASGSHPTTAAHSAAMMSSAEPGLSPPVPAPCEPSPAGCLGSAAGSTAGTGSCPDMGTAALGPGARGPGPHEFASKPGCQDLAAGPSTPLAPRTPHPSHSTVGTSGPISSDSSSGGGGCSTSGCWLSGSGCAAAATEEAVCRVLSLIRFPLLPIEQLHACLEDQLLRRLPGILDLVKEALDVHRRETGAGLSDGRELFGSGLCGCGHAGPGAAQGVAVTGAGCGGGGPGSGVRSTNLMTPTSERRLVKPLPSTGADSGGAVVTAGAAVSAGAMVVAMATPGSPAVGAAGGLVTAGVSTSAAASGGAGGGVSAAASAAGDSCWSVRYQRRCLPFALELMYVCDGDSSGVLHFLGTQYGSQGWVNPMLAKRVDVRASSPTGRTTDPRVIVGRQFVRTNFAGPRYVNGAASSWWLVDLGEQHQLALTYYTLRHDGSPDFARSWVLQGSHDLVTWVDLKRHTLDTTIKLPGQYGSWPVIGPAAAVPYRAFRLLLTAPNASPNPASRWNFCLSNLELYGFLYKGNGSGGASGVVVGAGTAGAAVGAPAPAAAVSAASEVQAPPLIRQMWVREEPAVSAEAAGSVGRPGAAAAGGLSEAAAMGASGA